MKKKVFLLSFFFLFMLFMLLGCSHNKTTVNRQFIKGIEKIEPESIESESCLFFAGINRGDYEASLIKGIGPDKEEALKLSISDSRPGHVTVIYYPLLGIIKEKTEYKVSFKYKTENIIQGFNENKISFFIWAGCKLHSIPLYNTNEWQQVEYTFSYSPYHDTFGYPTNQPVRVEFALGRPSYTDTEETSGTVYFIDFYLEEVKKEG